MKTTWFAGVLAAAVLTGAAQPLLAQDKREDRSRQSPRANRKRRCRSCSATAPLAKGIGPTACAIPGLPEGQEGRAWGSARQYGEAHAAQEGRGGRVLQDHGRLGRTPGRRPDAYGYAMFFMNAKGRRTARQRGMASRSASARASSWLTRSMAKTTTTKTLQGRHLRVRLRRQGLSGRPRHPGVATRSRRSTPSRGDFVRVPQAVISTSSAFGATNTRAPGRRLSSPIALLRQVHAHDRAHSLSSSDADERARRVHHQHRRAELARVGPAETDIAAGAAG